jgi:glutamate racemase
MNNKAIGIFDSGIGGLTVFKEIARLLPDEDIIYLGDTARVPYGTRSAETVTQYSFECSDFLLKKNITLLVVACNTVSAISLPEIRKKVPIPVIGVIEPGARAAVNCSSSGNIGVIGTEATVRSNAYVNAIKALNEQAEVFSAACPLFVPLVEEGWTEGDIALLTARKYLEPMIKNRIDTLVLGCTHYPLLKEVIQSVMGKDVMLIDSAVETAKVVKDLLTKESNAASRDVERQFYVTDSAEKFIKVGERFLKSKIEIIKKVTL